MNDTGPDSLIPYDEIVQEALRAVVGRVLGSIVATGGTLPGNHHFYITFKTAAPGVSIPAHLKQRFPDEMTIVLQNKFWELAVEEDNFSVGLTFNQVPAKLTIPFAAITGFVDPEVDFGLQFQAEVAEIEHEPHEPAENDAPGGEHRPAPHPPGMARTSFRSISAGRSRRRAAWPLPVACSPAWSGPPAASCSIGRPRG